ncbi:hypothetical protein [Uliginosibacterium sp. H1]|uniref:hypothetical protein n=1 Tax=Uliginosibacterium sp. H1 TaxID=3114757 RepID=UPI002E19058D|nr:hypothetical protein [Uliginosibacterium sp. H1]
MFARHLAAVVPAQSSRVSQACPPARPARISIRPLAILEVVRRRGRSWGLLAQYEEARLGIKR